ncbi:hypothetical protein [Glaciimonas immobilis]|nr:hypothetical protein [Glaciimonas immobilis]
MHPLPAFGKPDATRRMPSAGPILAQEFDRAVTMEEIKVTDATCATDAQDTADAQDTTDALDAITVPRVHAVGVHHLPWSFVLPPGALPFSGDFFVVGVMTNSCNKMGHSHPFVIFRTVSEKWIMQHLGDSRNSLFWLARLSARYARPMKDTNGVVSGAVARGQSDLDAGSCIEFTCVSVDRSIDDHSSGSNRLPGGAPNFALKDPLQSPQFASRFSPFFSSVLHFPLRLPWRFSLALSFEARKNSKLPAPESPTLNAEKIPLSTPPLSLDVLLARLASTINRPCWTTRMGMEKNKEDPKISKLLQAILDGMDVFDNSGLSRNYDPAAALQGVVNAPWINWPLCATQNGTAWFWQQDQQGRYVGQNRIDLETHAAIKKSGKPI